MSLNKHISLYVMRHSGSRVQRIVLPRPLLLLAGLLLLVGLAAVGYGVHDYRRLQAAAQAMADIEKQAVEQHDTIVSQRAQIRNFALEINRMKARMVALNNFEDKIRIIANIDRPAGEENQFGIGGSLPEDLATAIDSPRDHTGLMRDMHQQMGQLQQAALQQKDSLRSLLDALESQRHFLAATPAIKPAKGWISSSFGYRKSPFTGQREFHKGLDIANQRGTSILATADGVVKYVGRKGLLGNILTIDHGHGMLTRYAHLDKALKKAGDRVKRGDVIAEMGNTGRSTGTHVHYEVHLNGVPVNPRKYILN